MIAHALLLNQMQWTGTCYNIGYVYLWTKLLDMHVNLMYVSISSECLDSKILHPKMSQQMFGHMHGVLNKIYLQIFCTDEL